MDQNQSSQPPKSLAEQVQVVSQATQEILQHLQSMEQNYKEVGKAMQSMPYTPFRHYYEKSRLLEFFDSSEEFRDHIRKFTPTVRK